MRHATATAAALAVCLAAHPAALHADEADAWLVDQQALAEIEWLAPAEGGPNTLTADFPGGSIADYYEGLDHVLPGVSFVLDPDADRIACPPVNIPSISPRLAIGMPVRLFPGVIALNELRPGAFEQEDPAEEQVRVYTLSILDRENAPWLPDEDEHEEDRFDFAFPGGSLHEYADALRDAHPGINIVVMPGAGDVGIPPVDLVDVEPDEAIELLEAIREDDGRPLLRPSRAGGIYVIAAQPHRDPDHVARRVWSLAPVTGSEAVDADTALAAIEVALDFIDADADIRYHEPTGMLMISASREEIRLIEEVIQNLQVVANLVEDERARQKVLEQRLEHSLRVREKREAGPDRDR